MEHKRGKDLYDAVRLLVQNSLDSAESISKPPKILITIEENADDNQTTKKGKTENAPSGSQVKVPEEGSWYRVRCEDNGKGMSTEEILMLAADAGSTSLEPKQTRGQLDLDLKLLAERSRRQCIGIVSSTRDGPIVTDARLFFVSGRLLLHDFRRLEKKTKDSHGTAVVVDVEGDWTTYKDKILQFLQEIAYITPFAEIQFKAEASDEELDRMFPCLPTAPIQGPPKDLTRAGDSYLRHRIGLLQPHSHSVATSVVRGWQTIGGFEFFVEAAVVLGVTEVGQGVKIYRYANRVPLLFEEIQDVVTKTVNTFDWKAYEIATDDEKYVLVSIVSTEIPFGDPCKEYIEDDENIAAAVKSAIEECCCCIMLRRYEEKAEVWDEEKAQVWDEEKEEVYDWSKEEEERIRAKLFGHLNIPGWKGRESCQ